MGITWVAWNHLATPKRLGGTGILNLSKHMMARRFSLLQDMCSKSQPWISIAQYFIENKGLTHGRTKIEASWWQLLNGCISLRISGSTCVQHLATSWQEALLLCVWKPSSGREHCNSLHKELLVSSRLLCWPGKERLRSHFNRLFRLGVKEVGDIVTAQSQRILGFVEARHLLRIPPNYGFIWQQLQNIPVMQGPLPLHTEDQPWTDWCLKGQTSFLQVTTNLLYHCSVDSLGWLSSKAEEEWRIHKSDQGWWQILQRTWHSKLPLVAKVFIWRVLIGGLPLGIALKRRGLAMGNCFFCTVQMEDSTHRFIQCPIACQIWSYISQIWQVLSRCYLTPSQWVFAQFTQVDPKSEMEIVFLFLRYWGLRHNWNMRNAFVFDGRHGVKAYLRKLKGVLMWQFALLEHVEILSALECSSCLLAIQHVPLPM